MLLSGMQAGAKDITFWSWSHRVLSAIRTFLWKSHRPTDMQQGEQNSRSNKQGNDQYVSITLHPSINTALDTHTHTHTHTHTYIYIHTQMYTYILHVLLNWRDERPNWRKTFNYTCPSVSIGNWSQEPPQVPKSVDAQVPDMKCPSTVNSVSPLYPQILHPWIQPTVHRISNLPVGWIHRCKTCRYKRWTKQFLKHNDWSQAIWRLGDLCLNSKSMNSLDLPSSYKDDFILTSLKWHLRRRKVKVFNKGKFLFLPRHGETTVDID